MLRKFALIAFPVLAVVTAAASPAFAGAGVGVSVNIDVGPPPVLVAPPPALVMIPGTRIYFVPEAPTDIFFFDGSWWAPRGRAWYRADSPRGPWVVTRRRAVPRPLFRVPADYRVAYGREHRIPYGQWKKEHGVHPGRGNHGRRHD